MIDKVCIKIDPKHTVSIQIGNILPPTYSPLTGHENSENDTEMTHKIRLSISIGASEEKERLLCRE